MKNNFFKLTTLFFLVTLFIFTSCKDDADTQSAEDAARGGYMMADAFAVANDGTKGVKALSKRFSGCNFNFQSNVDGTGFSISFDNCTDDNGLTHNGTIIVTARGGETNEDAYAVFSITFDNYTVEDEGIDGEMIATLKTGTFGAYFNVTANELRLKDSRGEILYNYASLEYVFAISSGFKLSIYGEANGINREGKTFKTKSEDITISLFSVGDDCSGSMTVEVEGEEPLIINYDTGTCGEMEVSQDGRKKQTITTF